VLDANLRSVFLYAKRAIPLLRANGGGSIVTVSSALGLVGGDGDFATHAYAASKAGLIGLTRAMAVTYAPEGIRCNVVAPGLIETPMSARAQADPRIRARLADLQPLTGAFGAPEDVARACLYLATAPFVTGAVLSVDGGWTAQ
jgi:NAD(P)-dependent dehydrogenase (short-subunit alcohol dehydrogenase family)